MPDRKLLELAAKAMGYELEPYINSKKPHRLVDHESGEGLVAILWAPLDDDGEAFRIQVALGICITPYPVYTESKHSVIAKQRRNTDLLREFNPTEVIELYAGDPNAATRRAIVRCAAEIGRETGTTTDSLSLTMG